MPRPYAFWNRDELFLHLCRQADLFAYKNKERIKTAVFSERWNPMKDFNGCNVIQDKFHPYLPCFIHDYAWIVEGGGKKSDKEFYDNLVTCGTKKFKARLMYMAVRLGWLYFKYK